MSDGANVSGDPRASGELKVSGDPRVSGELKGSRELKVSGDPKVSGELKVSGEPKVSGELKGSSGDSRVSGELKGSSGEPIFAEERRRRILAMVGAQGRVRIGELVAALGVSEPTIRKDLSLLELEKLLKRTHGGAIAVRPQLEPTMDDRSVLHAEAKDLIAWACAAEIARGDSVFLDSGTTVQRIAQLLDQEHVNVLTNSLGVAAALAGKPPSIRHTLLGGTVHSLGGSVVGPIALETLSRFTVNIAFVSASGLDETGISVSDVAETQVKQAVIERARKVVVPVDSSKFGVTDFITVCGLDRVDLVITEAASDQIRELCADHGVELKVAGGDRP